MTDTSDQEAERDFVFGCQATKDGPPKERITIRAKIGPTFHETEMARAKLRRLRPDLAHAVLCEIRPVAQDKVRGLSDDRGWLNDLIKAAEAFRMAMVESGALDRVSQDKYFDQLRALEAALQPMNYCLSTPPAEPSADAIDAAGRKLFGREWGNQAERAIVINVLRAAYAIRPPAPVSEVELVEALPDEMTLAKKIAGYIHEAQGNWSDVGISMIVARYVLAETRSAILSRYSVVERKN